MLDPVLGKAAFHLAFYIVFCSGILLFFLERQTPEYVITQFTFAIGMVFIAIVIVLVKVGQRKQ